MEVMTYRELTMNVDIWHDGHHYRVTGFPSPKGSFIYIPAVRRNAAMPSGWELADIMVDEKTADLDVTHDR
jgi:hypothetical protein